MTQSDLSSYRIARTMPIKTRYRNYDVLLTPPIPETMKILDWHLGRDLSESARQYTAQRIMEHEALREMKDQL